MSHFRYGEDVAIQSAIVVCWFIRCCQQSIVHIECRIGPISEKLKPAPSSSLAWWSNSLFSTLQSDFGTKAAFLQKSAMPIALMIVHH